MRLEDEIRQERFASPFTKAVLNVLVTADRLATITALVLKPYGISREQYNVLRILRGQYPSASPLQLVGERMISRSSNATRLVEKLRQKGLVDRSECQSNRRQVDILITKTGLDLLKTLDPIILKSEENMKKLTESEAFELNRLLDKVRG